MFRSHDGRGSGPPQPGPILKDGKENLLLPKDVPLQAGLKLQEHLLGLSRSLSPLAAESLENAVQSIVILFHKLPYAVCHKLLTFSASSGPSCGPLAESSHIRCSGRDFPREPLGFFPCAAFP